MAELTRREAIATAAKASALPALAALELPLMALATPSELGPETPVRMYWEVPWHLRDEVISALDGTCEELPKNYKRAIEEAKIHAEPESWWDGSKYHDDGNSCSGWCVWDREELTEDQMNKWIFHPDCDPTKDEKITIWCALFTSEHRRL
jgi:hypothetical protein